MAHTANRAGPPRPSTTTRLLERKRVQRRPLPNRKDQNRGCGPWEAGGLPAAPRAASPGRLPGVSWCRDGQPTGQEGRLMRGASHPPPRPGIRSAPEQRLLAPRHGECPARRPLARFPTEAPAPPWDPRPRVLPGAEGPVRGRDPGSPAAPASLAGPLPQARLSSAPGVCPPGRLGTTVTRPGEAGGHWPQGHWGPRGHAPGPGLRDAPPHPRAQAQPPPSAPQSLHVPPCEGLLCPQARSRRQSLVSLPSPSQWGHPKGI